MERHAAPVLQPRGKAALLQRRGQGAKDAQAAAAEACGALLQQEHRVQGAGLHRGDRHAGSLTCEGVGSEGA